VNESAKRRLLQFGAVIAVLYGVLWGLPFLFRDDWLPSAAVLAATTVAGVLAVRPGWNLIPRRIDGATLLVLAATVASAVFAAAFLFLLGIPTPYDKLPFDPAAMLPLLFVFTGIEEFLYRQIGYRWLEQGRLSDRTIVLATATAWGCGHLGGALAPAYAIFALLQSLYLIGVGVLLGELRRRSGSWPIAWFGHLAYNTSFLFVFALIG